MYGDWHIDWLAVAAVLMSYFGAPIILSVAVGVIGGLSLPRISVFPSALIGFGIGVLGSFFYAFWGLLSLVLFFDGGMEYNAALALFVAGLVAASIACMLLTWTTARGRADSDGEDTRGDSVAICR